MADRARYEARGESRRGVQQPSHFRRILRAGLYAAAWVGLASACSEHARSSASDGEGAQALGHIHLALVTPEQAPIRLREAHFDISRGGAVVTSLDSESDPGASSLDVELPQGSFEILLHDGWGLERPGDAGPAERVPAALLTANPLPFDVQNARVTDLVYNFSTEQGVVTFGRGSASVSIAVATNAPTGNCNVLDSSGCPSGQTCLFAGDTDRTFCAQPGSLPVGQSCDSEQCVAGAQCLALDPAKPEQRACAEFCSPDSPSCGCQSLAVKPAIGICTLPRPPGVHFSHAFASGGAQAACNDWLAFRGRIGNATFGRVTLHGSRDGTLECSDPAQATRICRALRDGNFDFVNCNGHQWITNNCNQNELLVDSQTCGCTSLGNQLRPCNGDNFGGVGTETCGSVPQTILSPCA